MIAGSYDLQYQELLFTYAPRTIHTEEEYEALQEQVDALIDQGELSAAEQAYLDLLGVLISDYEARVEDATTFELRGIRLLQGLMELHELKQIDLISIFKTRSIASAVLSGKRQLTVEHINKLAAFFHLPHMLFFEPLVDEADLSNAS
ncbi:MAG: transcriptional regulator [Caldilineaceae bacterium]|nr:transcriptional regulator [Caldilineaceae bacterium]